MSGGSMNYLYSKIEYDATFHRGTPERKAFAEHLEKVAKALHDIEWVDSGDYGPGDENEAIRACLSEGATLNLSCKSVQARLATQWGYVRGGDAQTGPVWQNCPTHGRADARAWGCPECVREMRDEIQRLRAAVQANHEWHERTDDYGGYPESEICEINTAALALTTKTEGNP